MRSEEESIDMNRTLVQSCSTKKVVVMKSTIKYPLAGMDSFATLPFRKIALSADDSGKPFYDKQYGRKQNEK